LRSSTCEQLGSLPKCIFIMPISHCFSRQSDQPPLRSVHYPS
jgi:hypothetical protein